MSISAGKSRQVRIAWAGLLGVVLVCGIGVHSAAAQARPAGPATAGDFPAVMLSDLHFDPLRDIAKVQQLADAPVDQWDAILSQPDSPSQAEDFARMQKACKAKAATDSSYALLTSALQTAKAKAPDAQFVTVSGDLLVHDFDCRYRVAMKLGKADESQPGEFVSARFAEKTATYVMKLVESIFAGKTVYLALGNNDSECNHNRFEVNDPMFRATVDTVTAGLNGVPAADRRQIAATYNVGGYYAVTMAGPMAGVRLVVVNDVFMMSKFASCKGDEKDHTGADQELAWLTKELDGARQRRQSVWVLGHLPPVVNPKGTLTRDGDFCAGGEAESYMSTDALSKVLIDHSDVVKLGLFGHTHMDSLNLLGTKGAQIPIKIVPSVSPVDGNTPSFTVAKVVPAGLLRDYTVYKATNTTGVDVTWKFEYSFDETYRQTGFSTRSLEALIGAMRADAAGTGEWSRAYQAHYFKAAPTWELASHWAGFVCSLDQPTAARFKACLCGK